MTDRDHLARLYRDIFESDARGAVLLEDLIARFGGATVVTSGGIDAVLQTYRAGGQREVIDHIVRQINRANGAPDPNAHLADESPEG